MRSLTCILIAAAAVATGCGSSANHDVPQLAPVSTAALAPVSTAAAGSDETPPATRQARPAARPTARVAAAPALPSGSVPREVVGRWSGGEGDKTGEYLIITADGRYARGRNGVSEPYRLGVIVARGGRFVTYDVDGGREAGTWEYTNAAGIEVLGVYFGADYYSYARA